LQNGAHLPPTHRAKLALCFLQKIFALKDDFALNLGSLELQQLKECQRERTLSGAAFTDKAHNLSAVNFQRDIPEDTRLVPVIHRKPRGEQRGRSGHF
jgi:hypothetical protein